jgi:hypothetical protein
LGETEGLIFGNFFSALALERTTLILRYSHCLVDFCLEQGKFKAPGIELLWSSNFEYLSFSALFGAT